MGTVVVGMVFLRLRWFESEGCVCAAFGVLRWRMVRSGIGGDG